MSIVTPRELLQSLRASEGFFLLRIAVVLGVGCLSSVLGEERGIDVPLAPELNPDYAASADGRGEGCRCNRFGNFIRVLDAKSGRELKSIPVSREPVAVDITKDGRFLLVANHLPNDRADQESTAAVISVIGTADARTEKELRLPNGSTGVNGLKISPDGKFAAVTHLVARYRRLPTTPDEGWINANALTLVNLETTAVQFTVLLDDRYKGAANPWGVAWSGDGKRLAVAHAGTHEVSVMDCPELLAEMNRRPLDDPPDPELEIKAPGYLGGSADPADRLRFFPVKRLRVKLPKGDLGPRQIAFAGNRIYTRNHFSNTITEIDLDGPAPKLKSIPLGPRKEPTLAEKGEFYFNDASLCYNGWQSCASCHPSDGRSDGLNWDLLNDGAGNPKNTKSLLFAHRTPPSMSLGVRESAEVAVRSGLEHILFASPNEEVAKAIDAYLKSLKPVPSPRLVNGKLSAQAERGKRVAESAGCFSCHSGPLFTDQKGHDVGTGKGIDAGKPFDTPTLIELYRTGPYLHDGRAATLREVFVTADPKDSHGDVAGAFSTAEIEDMVEYLLSL